LRRLIILAALVGLVGCGAIGAPDVGPPPATITVKSDPYKDSIEYQSGVSKSGSLMDQDIWLLIAQKNRKTGRIIYYVQWANVYDADGWRFYSYANAEGGEKLEFEEVSRDVSNCGSGTCIHDETYNIYLTPEKLSHGATSGISFKIFARDGTSKLVVIPGPVISALREKMGQ
jgi:hypothetical protein